MQREPQHLALLRRQRQRDEAHIVLRRKVAADGRVVRHTVVDVVALHGEHLHVLEQGHNRPQAGLPIRAEPGAHMLGTAAEGKAALVIKGDNTVIEGLECSEIYVPDRNGACIRLEGQNLELRNVYFHDSEQGVLGGGGTILIENSKFERLGRSGQAHGLYVWGDEVILRQSSILSSKSEGHEFKSRAKRTVIEKSVIASLDGEDSRLIDISNGGEVIIRNNVLEQGPKSVNNEMIGLGYEGLRYENNEVLIEGNLILIDRRKTKIVGGPQKATIRNNIIVGGRRLESNTWYRDRAEAGLPNYPALPNPP